MTPKVFRSKVDTWLLVLLIGVIVIQALVLGSFAFEQQSTAETLIPIGVMLLVFAFIGSFLMWTYYSVEGPTLKIVCGVFRMRIPIDQITSIKATRNPLSSPALSLDRLRITYGPKNRKVMVSPADKAGFLRALGMELEE